MKSFVHIASNTPPYIRSAENAGLILFLSFSFSCPKSKDMLRCCLFFRCHCFIKQDFGFFFFFLHISNITFPSSKLGVHYISSRT
uniref:Uncharacterized protein n=1 Tax=Arundo donax TaxID=35708 RepID=A0A0A9CMA6_ARUDO